MTSAYSQFKQFNPDGEYNTDIEKRLWMEHETLSGWAGLPNDEADLIQLIHDAWMWVRQAKAIYKIPDNWPVLEEE